MSDAAASSLPAGSAPPFPEDDPPPERVLFRLGPVAFTPRRLLVWSLSLAAFLALTLFWSRLEIDELHARARALPAWAVIAAISLLPLVGLPVSILHLVAGVRFGFGTGMLVVGLTTVLHHVLGWALVLVLPRRCFARVEPWRARLRGAGYLDTTLLCCLLPGMPYTVQLYLKPIIGTPFRLMLGLSPLLHTARAVVTILLGKMSDDLTPGRITALVIYYIVLFTVSAVSLRHLRRALAMKNSADSARPDPAHVDSHARRLWQVAGSPPGGPGPFRAKAESELKKHLTQTAEQSRGQLPGALSPRPSTPSESAQPRRP